MHEPTDGPPTPGSHEEPGLGGHAPGGDVAPPLYGRGDAARPEPAVEPAPTSIRRTNPRKQGLVGLGDAIAWFCAQGYDVCLPLNDSQKYDLVIDDDGRLSRVQVKTTTARNRRGRFCVDLATNGGNRSRTTRETFDPLHYEWLYVLTDDRERYLIPSHAIKAGYSIVLGAKWPSYRVS